MSFRFAARRSTRLITRTRFVVTMLAGLAAAVALATPAQAHLPVFLTDANTAAAIKSSPYVPDGTISFAFYGWLDRPGDTRAVRIHLDAGQELNVQLLIPDLAPENALADRQLPQLTITCPNGRTLRLPSTQRVMFAEPYTSTNYLILIDLVRTAKTGTYTLIASGRSASRFVIANGAVDQFTAAIDNAAIGSVADVQHWYATPKSR